MALATSALNALFGIPACFNCSFAEVTLLTDDLSVVWSHDVECSQYLLGTRRPTRSCLSGVFAAIGARLPSGHPRGCQHERYVVSIKKYLCIIIPDQTDRRSLRIYQLKDIIAGTGLTALQSSHQILRPRIALLKRSPTKGICDVPRMIFGCRTKLLCSLDVFEVLGKARVKCVPFNRCQPAREVEVRRKVRTDLLGGTETCG